MKVALFAPDMKPGSGGIWQFYQWVVQQLEETVPLLLFAPSDLLAECNTPCHETTTIPVEKFQEAVKNSVAHRYLEKHNRVNSSAHNFLYRKFAGIIKHNFFNGNVMEHATVKMLIREGVNVVHIPKQAMKMPVVMKKLPYVINPHDYQHEYFPQFFEEKELEFRRNAWYENQRNADAIVVHSKQTRDDAIRFLGVTSEKVFYAPYGPLQTFPEPDEITVHETGKLFNLPGRFIFYPSRSWPHKNHIKLVEAIHLLKRKGLDINVVFTVVDNDFGKYLRQKINDLGMSEQVTIVGRVSPGYMGALYRLSTFIAVPSLFEQNSGPVLEAIQFGKAIAASRLDEIVNSLDGAGILFDPESIDEISIAIDTLWSSDSELKKYEEMTKRRRSEMSWEPFRSVYSKAYEFALSGK